MYTLFRGASDQCLELRVGTGCCRAGLSSCARITNRPPSFNGPLQEPFKFDLDYPWPITSHARTCGQLVKLFRKWLIQAGLSVVAQPLGKRSRSVCGVEICLLNSIGCALPVTSKRFSANVHYKDSRDFIPTPAERAGWDFQV